MANWNMHGEFARPPHFRAFCKPEASRSFHKRYIYIVDFLIYYQLLYHIVYDTIVANLRCGKIAPSGNTIKAVGTNIWTRLW